MQEEEFSVVVKQWMRIHNIEISNDIMVIIMETIELYFEKEEIINQLFVNIAVIGDDCSDKIGLIDNYIHDYNIKKLLSNNKKKALHEQNKTEILKFNKIVKLSSRNSVNISILCLSELQRNNLSEICTQSTKSIIFTYDLCQQSSLQSVRKWYKDCHKINDSFISILVGTNYETLKHKPANYRISNIEMSRKYAKKMKAILIFVSTSNKQQINMAINIKEIFLIILSKIYHFDSNISSISNSKLPIIEYYDKYISSGRRSTKSTQQKYNTITRSTQQYHTYNKYKNNYNNDNHNRTKTSINDIQNRLSIIRSNLTNNKHKNKHKNKNNKVEQLYTKFEKQYDNFMKNNIENENNSKTVHKTKTNDEEKQIEMYPSFLQKNINDNNTTNEITHSLSDLLQNDALGLTTLNQEDENELEKEDQNEQENIKRKKHERAMSMMPSLLSRSKTYDKAYKYNNNKTPKHFNVPRSQSTHNRAMPSMPNFLSKLQHDNQLKNIISSKFIANQLGGNKYEITKHKSDIIHNNNRINNRIAHINNDKHEHKEDVKKLKNKIQNLEASLSKYKNIMTENSKTVSVLKNTIQKIQTQRDEATRQIQVLNKNNGKHKGKEVEKLKNKNIELKSLADALAINLARKEQSLEEALDAMHTLNEMKEQITNGDGDKSVEHSKSRSLTDVDILEMHFNLEDDECDNDDDKDFYENSSDKQSFTKGIARKLRKSLTQLTDAKKSQ